MVLYDDLFNMRRQFYEESRRRWEEKVKKSQRCPWCGQETRTDNDRCEKCGLRLIVSKPQKVKRTF